MLGAGFLGGNVESRLDISLEDESPFRPLPGSLDVDIAAISIPIAVRLEVITSSFPGEGLAD